MVGKSKGGRMPATEFKNQVGVRAELENFVFEGVTFTVNSYTMYCIGGGKLREGPRFQTVAGNLFAPAQSLIDMCTPGTTVVIDEIKANGPGGTRKLPPVTFNLY
jgi:hypothetical protein